MNPAVEHFRAGPLPRLMRPELWARHTLLAMLVLVPACRGSRPVSAFRPEVAPALAPVNPAPVAPVAPPPVVTASTDEVVRAAVAVFGDSAVSTSADSTADDPVWDLDVRSYETHDRVEYYVELFSNKAKERFTARMSRGTRYEPMIRAKLRANGMPEDLTFLALIESGYDPHAYSRAAAVGMWQFMSSTARDVGMRVDWWVDERRDPARATDGAIRFLGYLQRQFGSFYLAAAAYNGGPGRVSRGLTRFADELEGMAGEDRFFALADQDYLRAETKNYVPQLIAAALVAKMPSKYGLTIDSLPLYEYDSVRVAPGTSLSAVALAGGLLATELRDLNPALLRGVVPPDAALWVRVPVGRAAQTTKALDSMPEAQARGYRTVRVGESVTPTSFASTHGVSLKHLRWFNPVVKTTKRGRLVAGQSLRIPEEAALTYARDIPDPSLEKFGGSGGSTTLRSRGVHVVKRGETLGGIARRYGLSERALKSMNGLRGTRLIAGQTLQIKKSTTASSTSSRVTSSKTKSQKSTVKKPSGKATAQMKKATSKSPKVASRKAKKKK